ncbi:MAG TPA: type IV pilus twitching motility protein PilT, partial [Polyangiales bacterium]
FRFSGGKQRRSNQPISHKQLVQLVREVATPEALDELRRSGRVRFSPNGGEAVHVRVDASAGEMWQVVISTGEFMDDEPAAGVHGHEAAPEQSDEWALPSEHDAFGSGTGSRSLPPEEQRRAAGAPPPPPDARLRAAQVPGRAPAAAPPPAAVGRGPAGSPPAVAKAPPAAPNKPPPSPPRAALAAGEGRLQRYLRAMLQVRASDLHLSSGAEPIVRVDGEMRVMEGANGPLRTDDLLDMMHAVAPADVRKQYEETNDADFAYEIDGIGRFRMNYFLDRRGPCLVARQIPIDVVTPEQLGLPASVIELCWLSKGLVLVTGPTGSGKSTTLASLVDFINRNRSDHIITIEDPIEYVHPNKRCLVNQRQVGVHTGSFSHALRAALREDPDVIVVGEMRDMETISIAIETAETGHLVFGTLHTTTAASTVDRIIDQFPSEEQGHIRSMLSESLRGVVSQVLCKRNSGGRAAAYEVLLATSAAQNLIREGKTYQIKSLLQTGRAQGMQSMNDHLFDLVRSNVIDMKDAYVKAYDKAGFRELLVKAGIRLDPALKAAD